MTWACFLSLARRKLRLCSANHRPGYWSNLPYDWPSIAWAYSMQETENWHRSSAKSQLTIDNPTSRLLLFHGLRTLSINVISVLTKFKITLILLLELEDKYNVKCFSTLKHLYNSQSIIDISMPSGTFLQGIRPKLIQARRQCLPAPWIACCVKSCSFVDSNHNWTCSWIW